MGSHLVPCKHDALFLSSFIQNYADHTTLYRCCSVSGDIISYPFCDLRSHEIYEGKLQSNILVDQFENITKKGQLHTIKIWFYQPGFIDQWCRDTSQFVTTDGEIRGPYSGNGHSHLQYCQQYSY